MATITKSTGRATYLGWAAEDEANPGVPVAPTDYVPIMPDQFSIALVPKRTVVEESTGSNFVDADVVDEEGTVAGDVQFALRADWGMALLFLAGFFDVPSGGLHVGTLTHPKPVTLEFGRAGQAFQHAGQFATKIKIASQGKAVPLITITFAGTGKPVLINPSTPSYTPAGDHPFAWKDFGSATLLAGGAGATSIDSFEIDIDLHTAAYYGNVQTGLPSDMIAAAPSIDIKFTRLFTDATEYTRFADDGQTPGLVVFGWSRPATSPSRSISIALPNAVYITDAFKQPLRAPIVENFDLKALSPGGAEPLTLSVLNSTTAPYTTS